MSDQRIQYDEEMVGANHPTKPDTLNRLVLAEHGSDGGHLPVTLESLSADPSGGDLPPAGYYKLYVKDGVLTLINSGGTAEEVGMSDVVTEHLSVEHTISRSTAGWETFTANFSEVASINDVTVILNMDYSFRTAGGGNAYSTISVKPISTTSAQFRFYTAAGCNGLSFYVEAEAELRNLV